MNLTELTYGVEIELEQINIRTAIEAVKLVVASPDARVFPTDHSGLGVKDAQGRVWKCVYDGSLRNGSETVTPPLRYEDMETLQHVVRALRAAGGKPASNAGIHVHVDGAPQTAKSLSRLARIVAAKESMIRKSVGVPEYGRGRYTESMTARFVRSIRHNHTTIDSLKRAWYRNNGGASGNMSHYHQSRYHGLNLHAFFQTGGRTVEFRWFNSTTHAGKIRAYVCLCLGMVARSINARSVSICRHTQVTNEYNTYNAWLRQKVGLAGAEFKNVRKHLMAAFTRTPRAWSVAVA